MSSSRTWLVALVALSIGYTLWTASASAHGEGDPRVEEARAEAMGHYHAGDYPTFVRRMEALTAISDDDTDDYNLACGYALAGQADRALATLRYLVDRGYQPDLADDEDFRSLRSRPEFYQMVAEVAFHEEADRRLEPIRDLAMAKYEARDYAMFVQIMERISKVSNTDVDLYNLACGYALTGRADQAIATLERLSQRGSRFDPADDPDFASLRGDPRFRAILARFPG